jgi:hypothetical protein
MTHQKVQKVRFNPQSASTMKAKNDATTAACAIAAASVAATSVSNGTKNQGSSGSGSAKERSQTKATKAKRVTPPMNATAACAIAAASAAATSVRRGSDASSHSNRTVGTSAAVFVAALALTVAYLSQDKQSSSMLLECQRRILSSSLLSWLFLSRDHRSRDVGQAMHTSDERKLETNSFEGRFPCTEENLNDFLHESPVKGLHIVCFESPNDSISNGVIEVRIFKRASSNPKYYRRVEIPSTASFETLTETLHEAIPGLRRYDPDDDSHSSFQPWALFSSTGIRLVDAAASESIKQEPQLPAYIEEGLGEGSIVSSLVSHGMALLFGGGQFLWPGVRVGFLRNVSLYSVMPPGMTLPQDLGKSTSNTKGHAVATLETLSLIPLVLSVKGFLSVEECDHIQNEAGPFVRYSGVALIDQDKDKKASDFRTSQSAFLVANNDAILLDIDYRTASLIRVPQSHQEPVQVLRYGHLEMYVSHHDFFSPELYQEDNRILEMIQHGRRNRFATVFWYLSDVEVRT